MTALATALEKAGISTAAIRLRSRAARFLRNWKLKRAPSEDQIDRFIRAIFDDRQLVIELVGRDYIRRCVAEYFVSLLGENEVSSAGHPESATPSRPAGAGKLNGDGEGLGLFDAHSHRAASSPAAREPADLAPIATHLRTVRPAREPTAADKSAAHAVAQDAAVTIFDTFKVHDGRGIGAVRWGELRRLGTEAAASSKDMAIKAAVIAQIERHAVAAHDALVRDVIKITDLQRFIRRASSSIITVDISNAD